MATKFGDKMKTAAERIVDVVTSLDSILKDYNNDGDWYGCVSNAQASLMEALRSTPPGFGARQPDEKYRQMYKIDDTGRGGVSDSHLLRKTSK